MKKVFVFITLIFSLLFSMDVYACGEIKNVKVSSGTLTQTGITTYIVTVKEGTDKITLSADTDYDWVNGYEPREVSTNNKVELKVDGYRCGYGIYTYFFEFKHLSNVVAENTEQSQENPIVTTQETIQETTENANELNQDLELQDMTIEGVEFEFDPGVYSYQIEVEADVTSLIINTTKLDETDTVTISENANQLVDGENKITISVVSADGATGVYELIVTKKAAKSNNNYLASLTVSGHTLNFDAAQTTYTVNIGKEKILNIIAVPESELATYEILGNSALKDGSTIIIRVTAEDESTRDYIINVKHPFNIMDYWMYIAVGSLTLLLIILLIINSKQKKKKKQTVPEEVSLPTETAGVIAPISQVPETPTVEPVQQPTGSGNLQFIEPTNVANNGAQPAQPVQPNQAQENPTEVFKL